MGKLSLRQVFISIISTAGNYINADYCQLDFLSPTKPIKCFLRLCRVMLLFNIGHLTLNLDKCMSPIHGKRICDIQEI